MKCQNANFQSYKNTFKPRLRYVILNIVQMIFNTESLKHGWVLKSGRISFTTTK